MLADWIIENMPEHKIYVEPFGGAASVLMKKTRVYSEIYNDLDSTVVNLFRVLQDKEQAAELERRLRVTPFAREEFELSYELTDEPIERARRTIILSFMGFGSDSVSRFDKSGKLMKTGFRCRSEHTGRAPSRDWVNYPNYLKEFTDRLMGVAIENRDAMEIIQKNDKPETLFFLDPPYVHGTRTSANNYRFEMDDSFHDRLLDLVSTLQGMVILCGYPNELYDKLGWHTVDRKAFDGRSNEKTERLWINKACIQQSNQMRMF